MSLLCMLVGRFINNFAGSRWKIFIFNVFFVVCGLKLRYTNIYINISLNISNIIQWKFWNQNASYLLTYVYIYTYLFSKWKIYLFAKKLITFYTFSGYAIFNEIEWIQILPTQNLSLKNAMRTHPDREKSRLFYTRLRMEFFLLMFNEKKWSFWCLLFNFIFVQIFVYNH